MIRNATISSIGMTVLAATAFIAAPVSATPVPPSPSSFGQLQYNGAPIAMTSGTGVGNDGYYMNTTAGPGAQQLLIGIKAHEYRNGNNPAGTSTVSSLNGGGSWLNVNGTTGAYTGIAGEAVDKPTWWSAFPANSATKWGFTWSITLNGERPAAGAISMNMLITRPNGQVSTILSGWDVGTNFYNYGTTTPSTDNPAWQNNWNVGYLAGCGGQASDLGDWKIKITALSGGTVYGEQEITVTATPAPGALALLGVAGIIGGRRRRA
jgi:MYXO-CTERM domain-containing protein